MLGVFGRRSGE